MRVEEGGDFGAEVADGLVLRLEVEDGDGQDVVAGAGGTGGQQETGDQDWQYVLFYSDLC